MDQSLRLDMENFAQSGTVGAASAEFTRGRSWRTSCPRIWPQRATDAQATWFFVLWVSS